MAQNWLTLASDLQSGRTLWSKEGRSASLAEGVLRRDRPGGLRPDAPRGLRHVRSRAPAIRKWLPNATLSPTLPRAAAHVEGLRGAENTSARECWCAADARQARAPPRCNRRRAYRRPLTLDCIAAMRHVADVVIRPLQGTVQEHQPLQKVRSTPHQVMRTCSFAFQAILMPDV